MPATRPSSSISATVETTAAQWFTRMRSDRRTVQDEDTFHRWLADSPEHEDAYLTLQALWSGLETHRDAPAIQHLREQALQESRSSLSRRHPSIARRLVIPLLAAAAAVIAAILVTGFATTQQADYRTAVGEHRTIRLGDGSELTLNTDTILRVHYTPWSRKVELQSGEAHFKVAHNPLRPFQVDAGDGQIRDLGTEFDVYKQTSGVQITLIEGQIEVRDKRPPTTGSPQPEATTMTATRTSGQQISLADTGLSPIRPVNISKATAWLRGLLVFDQERLADAVAEINRYATTKLRVQDPKLAELRISGVFHTDSAKAFISTLRQSFSIVTRPAPDGTLLLTSQTP
ncbi:MAG: iron dicitrate transport regulator FecR [Nevskia sp.]|nr:iron dicitrate transport regulator FecR [Nevskia sp.]